MFGELIPRLKDSSLNQACQELNMVMRSPRVNGNKPGDRIFCLFWVVVGFIFLGNICEISAVNFKEHHERQNSQNNAKTKMEPKKSGNDTKSKSRQHQKEDNTDLGRSSDNLTQIANRLSIIGDSLAQRYDSKDQNNMLRIGEWIPDIISIAVTMFAWMVDTKSCPPRRSSNMRNKAEVKCCRDEHSTTRRQFQ